MQVEDSSAHHCGCVAYCYGSMLSVYFIDQCMYIISSTVRVCVCVCPHFPTGVGFWLAGSFGPLSGKTLLSLPLHEILAGL